MKSNEIKLEELKAVNGGDFPGIGEAISRSFDKITEPAGSFAFNTVHTVIDRPYKPINDVLEEMETETMPLKIVKLGH